jgi:hypothetical protein
MPPAGAPVGAVVHEARLITADLADTNVVRETLLSNRIEAVVHLAADSLVGESVADPAKYYANNVISGLSLRKPCLHGVSGPCFPRRRRCAATGQTTDENPIGTQPILGERNGLERAALHETACRIVGIASLFNATGHRAAESTPGDSSDPNRASGCRQAPTL